MVDFANSFADRTTLIWMAMAALAGAGLVLSEYVLVPLRKRYHDWRLARRLARGTDSYFEELRSLEAYRPEKATEDRHWPLPVSAAVIAVLFASMVWAWREGRDEQFTFYTHLIVAVVALWALYRIAERRRTELALPPSTEERDKSDKEMFREGSALAIALLYLAAGWFGH